MFLFFVNLINNPNKNATVAKTVCVIKQLRQIFQFKVSNSPFNDAQ